MSKTILLVSGNDTLGMFLGILLKRMGFGLISTRTGPEAAALVRVVRPDAVLVDSELATFDGLDTLDRLKEGGPSIPPVIMLVGSQTEEAESRCLSAGACTVITKPVSTRDLHQAVQECMFMMKGVRRRHVRARADIRVTVNFDGNELNLMTESLSAGGAFVRYDATVPVGTVMDVFLPIGDEECLFLTGRVVYNSKPCPGASGFCQGFALEFLEPGVRESEEIEEFVSRFMTEDLFGIQVAERPVDGDEAGRTERRPGPGVYSALKSYISGRDASVKENA